MERLTYSDKVMLDFLKQSLDNAKQSLFNVNSRLSDRDLTNENHWLDIKEKINIEINAINKKIQLFEAE